MILLTRAAERAVYAATRRGDVSALRLRLSERTDSASTEGSTAGHVVVTTEPADALGPGETVIRQGAAAIYVPAALTRRYEQATLDLLDREAVDAPSLVLRGVASNEDASERYRS